MAKRRRGPVRSTATDSSDELKLALPGGSTMSIGFKPMPPGVTAQRLQMTAVYAQNIDTLEPATKFLAALYPGDSRHGLRPGSCRVVARTAAAPQSFRQVVVWERDSGGARHRGTPEAPLVTLSPPNETLTVRFNEAEALLRMDRLFSTAERIRNLVTFAVGHAVPMAVQLTSADFLHTVRMDAPPPSDVPRAAVEGDPAAAEGWYDGFRRGYAEAQRCLDLLKPAGPESRAISLVGEAMWSPDVEERFFYCWRALEVIGNLDLELARRLLAEGVATLSEPYLRLVADTVMAGQAARIDTPARVRIAVAKRFPELQQSQVDQYYRLRNAIAHGDVSAEQHLEILKAGPDIFRLARESARGFVPPVAPPRRPGD